MSKDRNLLSRTINSLKQQRDEIRLQLHLAELEVKEEWDELEKKWNSLNDQYKPLKNAVGESSEQVWESVKALAGELNTSYKRVGKALLKQMID